MTDFLRASAESQLSGILDDHKGDWKHSVEALC